MKKRFRKLCELAGWVLANAALSGLNFSLGNPCVGALNGAAAAIIFAIFVVALLDAREC